MMKDLDFKDVSNVKIGSRIRQVILLLVVILVGILISISSEAMSSAKAGQEQQEGNGQTPVTLEK